MKYLAFYLTMVFFAFGCGDVKKENKSKSETNMSSDVSKIGRNNYAVVWKWKSADVNFIMNNLVTISTELTALWEDDIIENAYYNSDSKVNKLDNLPNISFFIKSSSEEEANLILDKLTLVKKDIATYKLYPVGSLWLDRKIEKINENGITKSFVTIWETKKQMTEEIKELQFNTIMELWNEGKIENIYFDIQGTKKQNNITDFVFFSNTNTIEETIALCKTLPIFKEKIATFNIIEVGVFWMGIFNKK